MKTVTDFIFLGSRTTADGHCSHEIKRCLLLRRKTMTNLGSLLKSRDITLPTKVGKVRMYSQSYGFSSSHVWMWELDLKEGWASKNWYFWTVVLEKTLESPLDCKEIKPVSLKGNQSWIFIGRADADADAEAESPILWPPNAKSWLIGKDPDAGKDLRQEEKGMTSYMQSTSWEMYTGWNTPGIKIAGRNVNNLRYPDTTTLIPESEEELQSLWLKVREESGKADLKPTMVNKDYFK